MNVARSLNSSPRFNLTLENPGKTARFTRHREIAVATVRCNLDPASPRKSVNRTRERLAQKHRPFRVIFRICGGPGKKLITPMRFIYTVLHRVEPNSSQANNLFSKTFFIFILYSSVIAIMKIWFFTFQRR